MRARSEASPRLAMALQEIAAGANPHPSGFARHLLPEGEGGAREMEHTPIGAAARESLLLRPRLLRPAAHSARALDRGERNGADAPRAVSALRREGIEAYRFDGAEAEPGWSRRSRRPRRSSSPSRRATGQARRSIASGPRSPPRRRCGASSTIRPSGSMATTAARGSTRPARRGRERRADWRGSRTRPAGRRRPGRGAPKPTSCASPESMGPAAMRSSICAAARRGGSSSRGRCSTAPMSMTSLRFPASC